jgi:hypothetical protein
LQIGALNRFLPMVVPLDGQKCEMTLQQFVNARRRLLPSVAQVLPNVSSGFGNPSEDLSTIFYRYD